MVRLDLFSFTVTLFIPCILAATPIYDPLIPHITYPQKPSPFTLPPISFKETVRPTWGNFVPSPDGKTVSLSLDREQGAGFASLDTYQYGFFSAKMKLPSNSNCTAGIVVSFYLSNGEIYPDNRDQLSIEFLGRYPDSKTSDSIWKLQTNVFGNGSDLKNRGREERYHLWFDPSVEVHQYSILITEEIITFFIDEVPIREVIRGDGIGGDYPSKPMSLYGSIYDGSGWATNGGTNKIDYSFAPFESVFSDLVVKSCVMEMGHCDAYGCVTEPCDADIAKYAWLTPEQRSTMSAVRWHYQTYWYCYDTDRYKTLLPECVPMS